MFTKLNVLAKKYKYLIAAVAAFAAVALTVFKIFSGLNRPDLPGNSRNASSIHIENVFIIQGPPVIVKDPSPISLNKSIDEAHVLQRTGKIEEAIEKWRSITNGAERTNNDLAARAWFSISYLYLEQNKREKALSAYNEAIRLKPDFAEAYTNRGAAYVNLGKYAEAIADFDEAIRLKPDFAEAYFNRGVAKGKLGKYREAIGDYNEAIRLKPDFAEAYTNRGAAYVNLEKYAEAIADFDEAIPPGPGHIKPPRAGCAYLFARLSVEFQLTDLRLESPALGFPPRQSQSSCHALPNENHGGDFSVSIISALFPHRLEKRHV